MDSDIYLLVRVIMEHCTIYFVLTLPQLWPLGAPSIGSYVPLIYTHHCGFFKFLLHFALLSTFSLSGTIKYSKLIFYIPHSTPEFSHFFKELRKSRHFKFKKI